MARSRHGKEILDRVTPAGWVVIVMPDYVKIDSYHGPPHIHTNPREKSRDRKLPIRKIDPAEVLETVLAHIEANRGIDWPRLLRELGAEEESE